MRYILDTRRCVDRRARSRNLPKIAARSRTLQQEGYLFEHHGAWFVRYRERVQRENGSIKLCQRAKMLGRVKDYPRASHIKPVLFEFMQRLNAGRSLPESNMALSEFVETVFVPYIQEKRASTRKGYAEIWQNHIRDRVGHIRLSRSEPFTLARCSRQ
jgi:hypothetical protein